MKYYNRILLLVMVAGVTVSCADAPFADFKTEKPESLTKYEYLNEYGDLKSYIDRTTHPNFKLGTGITVSDFLKQDLVYSLVVSNYDDVTAGNAMKYSSCVDAKGNMDFGTVKKFVKTAKAAGISIYGHTFCWHSQQQNTYLNGLIADKEIEIDPGATEDIQDAFVDYSQYDEYPFYKMTELTIINDNGELEITNTEALANWQIQYFCADGVATTKGGNYKVTALIKGTSKGSLGVNMGDWGASASASLEFTTEWKEVTVNLNAVPATSSFVTFQSGAFVGTIQMKWLKVSHTESTGGVVIKMPVIEDDFSSGTAMIGWGNNSTRQVVDGVHEMTNPSETNAWSAQAGYDFTTPLTEGTTYFLTMKIKGTVPGSIGAAFQKTDGYAGRGDFPSISITTDWEEVTVFTNCTGDGTDRFLLNYGKYVGTIYIDDLSIYWQKSGNTIPLTPEEKKEILTNEMERWTKGMLEACDGYVKAWDVVNEPISGRDTDGDGYYNLQSASQTDDNGVSGENFYWQDYLGDDYVRIPIKFARKYFEESGGNPDELKLFINDYNLESDWDDNKKLKSLIHWIERWESDGETKVDGIGTQMHVSYFMNPSTQASKERAIVNMFTLLASTGKLIKVTELDMGIVDAAGETILTENLTDEMQQNMSDFYKFIIEKFFEIIPVAQQYGITHWSPTDSPSENSFWRKGQPIGLWNLDYNRKPVYVGFLEGLKNGTTK